MKVICTAVVALGFAYQGVCACGDVQTVRRDSVPVLEPIESLEEEAISGRSTRRTDAERYGFSLRPNPSVGVDVRHWDEVAKYPRFEAVGSGAPMRGMAPPGVSAIRAVKIANYRDETTGMWQESRETVWEWQVPEELQPADYPKYKCPRWALSEAFDARGGNIERFGAVCLYTKELDEYPLYVFDATKGLVWTAVVPVGSIVSLAADLADKPPSTQPHPKSNAWAEVSMSPSGHRVLVTANTVPKSTVVPLFIYDGRTGKLLRTLVFPDREILGGSWFVVGCDHPFHRSQSDRYFTFAISKPKPVEEGVPRQDDVECYLLDYDGNVLCSFDTPKGPVIVTQISKDNKYAFGSRYESDTQYQHSFFDVSSLSDG